MLPAERRSISATSPYRVAAGCGRLRARSCFPRREASTVCPIKGVRLSSSYRPESEYQLHSPSLLPDGRHFLYTAIPSEPDAGGIYVGSLDSNEKVRILADRSNARYVKGPSGKGYLLYWRNGGVVAHPFDAAARKVSGNPVTVADQVN